MTIYRVERSGTELILASNKEGLPEVFHWGAPLGAIDSENLVAASRRGVSPSALDQPWPLTVLPTDIDGWQGRPALVVRTENRVLAQKWTDVHVDASEHQISVQASTAQFSICIEYRVNSSGVIEVRQGITNNSVQTIEVSAFESVLPVGENVSEVLDFSGRWIRERAPQRAHFTEGTRVRESRRGRTGHDSPMVAAAGTLGFSNSVGDLWAVHIGWSADVVYRQDNLPEARPLIGGGALLRPGEVLLSNGETFQTPVSYFAWSDKGLDGIGRKYQGTVRANRPQPLSERPVTLNTWEAVYFDHNLEKLRTLAEVASRVGVERFVLDDGWFLGRRKDDAGLGDWTVDEDVWPEGLHPLVNSVHELGMEFGLWFEPEMVNEDSNLARLHPDWVLGAALETSPRTWRGQHLLDLSRPDVREYLFSAISSLVREYKISYIKWDQNRDVLAGEIDGQSRLIAHTQGTYKLISQLKEAHPGLEIESCASGGARIDLGILEHTDRVWASDTNDPLERLEIQRWTELLVPPEYIGSHIGPETAHTTGRHTEVSFRAATALMNSFGIETDIAQCSADEIDQYRKAISAYKRLRKLLHSGVQHHLEDASTGIHGTLTVDPGGMNGVLRLARVATASKAQPSAIHVPGLNPETIYKIQPLREFPLPKTKDSKLPGWLENGELTASGAFLEKFGLRLAQMLPAQALVLEITAT